MYAFNGNFPKFIYSLITVAYLIITYISLFYVIYELLKKLEVWLW